MMVGIVSMYASIISASLVVYVAVDACSAPWSWIWTFSVVGRLGSSRDMLKLG